MKNGCVYYHSDNICDEFLRKGMCSEPKSVCLFRHPKECKYWLGDTKGCLRGELCNYFHKTENEERTEKSMNRHVIHVTINQGLFTQKITQ